jgi:hypothetical protein
VGWQRDKPYAESLLNGVARNRRANWTAFAQRALFQIPPRRVQGPRLASRLSELLDAHSKTADDVAADKRGLHGRSCQAAFEII